MLYNSYPWETDVVITSNLISYWDVKNVQILMQNAQRKGFNILHTREKTPSRPTVSFFFFYIAGQYPITLCAEGTVLPHFLYCDNSFWPLGVSARGVLEEQLCEGAGVEWGRIRGSACTFFLFCTCSSDQQRRQFHFLDLACSTLLTIMGMRASLM